MESWTTICGVLRTPPPQLLFVISDGAGLTAGTKPFPDPKEEREEKKKKDRLEFP